MSFPENDCAAAPGSADPIEAAAALWLQRRQFWDWSAVDQAQLDAWLSESTAHEVAYIRLLSGYGRTERLVALRAPRTSRLNAAMVFRAAVGAAAIAIIGASIAIFSAPGEVTYTTPIGGRQTIMLTDGSRIDLNTNSALRISTEAGRRFAALDRGEAYFQIKHDAARPFVVTANGHRVTDLGTKFLIRSSPARMDVTLVEGRARIDTNKGAASQSVDLTPGDEVVATAHAMTKVRKSTQDLGNELGWRRGVIVFRRTALFDAAAQFNRYNPNKIVIESAVAGQMNIDGTFPTDDPESFAEIAQDILHLRVKKRADTIVITK